MSNGVASLGTFRKQDPSGPPFVPASARNGCSVDASGAIVLGNDSGAVLAVLLNNREIPLAGFKIDFTDPVNSTIVRINNADDCTIDRISKIYFETGQRNFPVIKQYRQYSTGIIS